MAEAVRRANVALVDRAAEALDSLCLLTGLSQTDVVNRALQLYADLAPYVGAVDGRAAYIREPDGDLERFRVL